jgi:hypothetical protein
MWVVGSVLWVIFVGSTMNWSCLGTVPGSGCAPYYSTILQCIFSDPWAEVGAPALPRVAVLQLLITALGYPLAVLALGWALLWAARGFKK